jgi:hypothetical protein
MHNCTTRFDRRGILIRTGEEWDNDDIFVGCVLTLVVSSHTCSWYDLILIVASQDNNVCIAHSWEGPVTERYTDFGRRF